MTRDGLSSFSLTTVTSLTWRLIGRPVARLPVALKLATCPVDSVASDAMSDVFSLSMTITTRLTTHNCSHIAYQMILRHVVDCLFQVLEIELILFTAVSTSEHPPRLAKRPRSRYLCIPSTTIRRGLVTFGVMEEQVRSAFRLEE